MNKLWVLFLLVFAMQGHSQTQADKERCTQVGFDKTELCVSVKIRDFQIWDNALAGLVRHSDFENFADLNNTAVGDVWNGVETIRGNHLCGNVTKTNRDWLEGAAASGDQALADWANGVLTLNEALANQTLLYGKLKNGTKATGFSIEFMATIPGFVPPDIVSGSKGDMDWFQPVKITQYMVMPTLGADGKPVKTVDACDNTNFNQWFNDVPGVNYTIDDFIFLSKISDNGLSKSYQISSNSYFPLDKYNANPFVPNWNKQGYSIWCGTGISDDDKANCEAMRTGNFFDSTAANAHNYGYTMEGEIPFAYHGGEVFTFSGDDDMWIFIDGVLKADIGGVHLPGPQTLKMDQIAYELGWELHTEHVLKFFYADRQTDGSNLIITTTLNDIRPPEGLPPAINKAYTFSGSKKTFEIFSTSALSEATLAAVNSGAVPDFIYRYDGNTFSNDPSQFPVVTAIKALPAEEATKQFGSRYEITISENRPNQNDSIAFNVANKAGVAIEGANMEVQTALFPRVVEFFYSTTPAEPNGAEVDVTINRPAFPILSPDFHKTLSPDGSPVDVKASGFEVPINRGAEITFIPLGGTLSANEAKVLATSNSFGNIAGLAVDPNLRWGMIGNPANPAGLSTSATGSASPSLNCIVDAAGNNSCFNFQFTVKSSFRLSLYVYDHNGQFVRQYSQHVSKALLDSIRGFNTPDAPNAFHTNTASANNPIITEPEVAINLNLYPIATDGRLLGNGVYIITYDLIEFPENNYFWDSGVNSSVIKEPTSPNRTIQNVQVPYKRSVVK